MLKITDPSQYTRGEPITSLVPTTSYGIDREWLRKYASARSDRFKDIKPSSKNHSLIHVVAMTASEATGNNRNADYWPETSKHIELADPDAKEIVRGDGRRMKKTAENWTDRINKGLIETHKTFLKGAVYRDHKNQPKKGDKRHGDIRAVEYDPEMRRVDALTEVRNDDKDWIKDIETLDKGGDIPWSMASNVEHDVCSNCGNKARTRKDYCECLKHNMGQMLKSGHVVCAINENPDFFDLSKVGKPADRLAWSMRKLASDGQVEDPNSFGGLTVPLSVLAESQPDKVASRLEVLDKMADIEKRIEGKMLARTSILAGKRRDEQGKKAEFTRFNGRHDDLAEIMAAFKQACVILPIEQFTHFVLGEEAEVFVPQVKAAMVGLCGRLMSEDALELAVNDTYTSRDGLLFASHQKIARDLSTDWGIGFDKIQGQVISAALSGMSSEPSMTKRATAIQPVAHQVAKEYATYLMTAISEQTKQGSAERELACEVLSAQIAA